ncbi:MAG: DDHD domain-containing protein [Benjaminiella poitrasii]|nr:MAG: DDHD domain-containing protein [Benjaminiella poitrasii]
MKLAYNAAITSTSAPTKPNGIQLLPIMWRQDIKFGMAADGEGYEADLGTVGMEDGCPTLDELTLEGVPNIRTVVSDVLMDIPLYMTPRYRELMTQIIAKELNRVYRLFCSRNPEFEKKGKVSIFGHSLGSLLAFDVLTLQPVVAPPDQHIDSKQMTDKKLPPPLLFPVQNFFAAGSPLGVILLLRGFKIASRKALAQSNVYNALSDIKSPSPISINFCYPAVENLYNIFHKSDPVAYRLEPLIARHYTSKLKPEYIPYMKGGLKGVIDASFNVGSGIANRAGAMYESIKMGLTTNMFMRGLGLSRQQIYEDMHSTSKSPDNDNYSQGVQKLKMMNKTGRVDYCLKEGLLENPYLSAFSAHMQYWQDVDVAAFLVRQIYYNDND